MSGDGIVAYDMSGDQARDAHDGQICVRSVTINPNLLTA